MIYQILLLEITTRDVVRKISTREINQSNDRLLSIMKSHNIAVPFDMQKNTNAYYIYVLVNNDDIFKEYVGNNIYTSCKDISVSLGSAWIERIKIYQLVKKLNLFDNLKRTKRIIDMSPYELLQFRIGNNISSIKLDINMLINKSENNQIQSKELRKIAKQHNIQYSFIKEYCKNIGISVYSNSSSYEEEFEDILSDINPQYIRNDRKLLHRKELDFLYKDESVAIEINPTFTHNSSFGWDKKQSAAKPKDYHINKWKQSLKADIQLITLFENYLTYNKDDAISFIDMSLNQSNLSGDMNYAVNEYIIGDYINNKYLNIGDNTIAYDESYTVKDDNNEICAIIYVNNKNIVNISLSLDENINIGCMISKCMHEIGLKTILLNNNYGINYILSNYDFKIKQIVNPTGMLINISDSSDIMDISLKGQNVSDDYVELYECGYSIMSI